jgi:hypothetical protein
VRVGAIEASPRKGLLEPAEEALVADVHAECDVGLTSVAAEVAFADEQAEDEPLLERVEHGRMMATGCFTVKFPVKHPGRVLCGPTDHDDGAAR